MDARAIELWVCPKKPLSGMIELVATFDTFDVRAGWQKVRLDTGGAGVAAATAVGPAAGSLPKSARNACIRVVGPVAPSDAVLLCCTMPHATSLTSVADDHYLQSLSLTQKGCRCIVLHEEIIGLRT
jgi:hypothetical protein